MEELLARLAKIENPALREALHYRIERQAMNNPKGWDHVRAVLLEAYSARAIECTREQYAEAAAVLAILAAIE